MGLRTEVALFVSVVASTLALAGCKKDTVDEPGRSAAATTPCQPCPDLEDTGQCVRVEGECIPRSDGDGQMTKLLVGTWKHRSGRSAWRLQIRKDGTWLQSGVDLRGRTGTCSGGPWSVKDRALSWGSESCSGSLAGQESPAPSEIVEVTGRALVLELHTGDIWAFRRSK